MLARLVQVLSWAAPRVAVVTFAIATSACTDQAPKTNAKSAERILPTQVNLSNVELFENQMVHDLPAGTPKEGIDSYLADFKIPHGYWRDSNMFFGELDNIGTRMGFAANLTFQIHLDVESQLETIEFHVKYLPP